MEIITIKEFESYTSEKKEEYLYYRTGVKDNILLCKIENIASSGTYAFLRVVNKQTGEEIKLFKDEKKGIFCVLPSKHRGDMELKGGVILGTIDFCKRDKEDEHPIKIKSVIGVYNNFKQFIVKIGLEQDDLSEYDKFVLNGDLILLDNGEHYIGDILSREIENKVKVNKERAIKKFDGQLTDIHLKVKEAKECLKNQQLKTDELKIKQQYIMDSISEAMQETSFLKSIGFSIPNIEVLSDIEVEFDADRKKVIQGIDYFLQKSNGLYYDFDLIERFYHGLCTSQIIILCGPPGTGKTSLPAAFAKAVEGVCKVVSVQPNWTDNQDLLGFYNPVDKRYMPTFFLDTIIEAKENADKLYIVCLDEMNLAHIEYYFSEILSAMEQSDRSIQLYSDYYFTQELNTMRSEIGLRFKEVRNMTDDELKEWLENIEFEREYQGILARWNQIRRYPSKIAIPRNIRFVGTMNMDETTKGISPKVIDRSYVLEMRESISPNGYEERECGNQKISASYFMPQQIKDSEWKEGELLKLLDTLKKVLKPLNIEITKRFEKQAKELLYLQIDDEMIDYILVSKILPKLDFEIDDNNEVIYEELKRLLRKYRLTSEKLISMCSLVDQVVSYWR